MSLPLAFIGRRAASNPGERLREFFLGMCREGSNVIRRRENDHQKTDESIP